jgi:hypothetical protein
MKELSIIMPHERLNDVIQFFINTKSGAYTFLKLQVEVVQKDKQ